MYLKTITFYFLACHAPYHFNDDYRRRKRSIDYDDTEVSLVNFFTDCMTSSSNVSMDWYSATDWAIEDSNWFYYTNTRDCAG